MPQFRKKPVVIEARQWLSAQVDAHDLAEWAGADYDEWAAGPLTESGDDWGLLTIPTLEGDMTVAPGDFIIRGVQGEFYPCKPDIFEATYDPA